MTPKKITILPITNKDFNIKISLIKPIKGGNPMFKTNTKKTKIINKFLKVTSLVTIKERVLIQPKAPINQNIREEIIP